MLFCVTVRHATIVISTNACTICFSYFLWGRTLQRYVPTLLGIDTEAQRQDVTVVLQQHRRLMAWIKHDSTDRMVR
uniref:Putative secreted protein n=1 Tax=Anopheles darlingi TaxID=43151 RepID=A0A2M4DDC7_ANODA